MERHTILERPFFNTGPRWWRRFWSRSNERVGYLFILPSFVHLILFLVIPLVFSLYLSFTDWRGTNFYSAPFVGTANYEFMLGDRRWWNAMANSGYYTLLSVPLGMAASLLIALVMNMKLRGVNLFRTLFFMPVISSWVAVSVIWITLLDPQAGLVNYTLQSLGLPTVNWLGDPASAMPSLVLITIWKGAGFNMVIWLAGLQAIPQEMYEAAAIDGAGILSRFRHITYPQLLPLMVINFVGAFIAAFQGMGSIFLLTFGGPGDATNVLSLAIWKEAYNNLRFSTATTMAWFLGVALIGFTYLQIRILRKVEFRRASTN